MTTDPLRPPGTDDEPDLTDTSTYLAGWWASALGIAGLIAIVVLIVALLYGRTHQ